VCDLRNSPSNQPGIVWSKRSVTTQCTNPQCFKELLYLREGRLELHELEPDADDQLGLDDGAFAMRPLPSKCFWLCGECAITYILKRWTASGLVVVLRNQNAAGGHPDPPARRGSILAQSRAASEDPTHSRLRKTGTDRTAAARMPSALLSNLVLRT
jgi:hypothetical protein